MSYIGDDNNGDHQEKCTSAISYKSEVIKEPELTIPSAVVRVYLGVNFPDVNSAKTFRGEDRRPQLLRYARWLKEKSSFDEIISAVATRNKQRCRPPLSWDLLEEIVHKALNENTVLGNQECTSHQFEKWRYVPSQNRIWYEDDLEIKINEHHVWTFDFLGELYRYEARSTTNKEIVGYLNDQLEIKIENENKKALKGLPSLQINRKTSRNLRDWAFNSGTLADKLIGAGRLISTGGGEIGLNPGWNPYEDPKVGKIFTSK